MKDLWFDAFVERQAELEEAGIPPELAEEMAAQEAMGIVSERFEEAADNARDRAKYEGH